MMNHSQRNAESQFPFIFWSSVGFMSGLTWLALPLVLPDRSLMHITLGIITVFVSFFWLFRGEIVWTDYKVKHLQKVRNAILSTLIPIAGILFLATSYINGAVNYVLTLYLVILLGVYICSYLLMNKRISSVVQQLFNK